MLRRNTCLISSLFTLMSTEAISHDWNSARPDSHAPIGVMGDHTHKTGEWMVSYRAMSMSMDSLRRGSSRVSPEAVLAEGYGMTATDMTMDMHMFGLMYAPTDRTTLMMMTSYQDKEMDMLMAMPMGDGMMDDGMDSMMDMPMTMNLSMASDGVGDTQVGALHNILDRDGYKVHLNLMVSMPTGSIDEKNAGGQALPYAMQLGSGTWDLRPGITFNAQRDNLSFGAQANALIRLGENDRDYTLGNRYQLQSWVQKPIHPRASVSLRLSYENWDSIDGADSTLNPMMTPLADPDLQGGERLVASAGVNVTLTGGHRLALEYSAPLNQDLDGPQMALDDSLNVAWQLAF